MNVYVCFYTNENYRYIENHLIEHYEKKGFTVLPYRSENVKIGDFYIDNKEILDCERGDGYWLWKPKIIIDLFNKIKNDDVIIYIDAGDIFHSDNIKVKEFFNENDYYFYTCIDRPQNKQYTKRDCFILMGCDEEKYYNYPQIEAGIIMLKKTEGNINLVNEWFHYAKDYRVITDSTNECGLLNFPEFVDHRHDQSILSNLFIKYNKQPSDFFKGMVNFNSYGKK